MLDVAMGFLKDQLQAFLVARTGGGPDARAVNLTQLVNDQGRYALAQDTLGLSLINIEEERVFRAQLPSYTLVDGRQVMQEPEVKLNLHVLVAANFRVYDEALRYLSLVLAFFQSHPAFTADAFPSLDARIGKLTAELHSLSYEQLNQMWAFVGGKQLPSLVYKIRLVVVQDQQIAGVQLPVSGITQAVGGR